MQKVTCVGQLGRPHRLLVTLIMPLLACMEQSAAFSLPVAPNRGCGAPWVAASLGPDLDHAFLCMLGEEIRLLRAARIIAIRRLRDATVFVAVAFVSPASGFHTH